MSRPARRQRRSASLGAPVAATDATVQPLTARDGLAALVLALLFALAASVRLVPGVVGAFHDDGVYAITAKALAQGDGYRLINLPGAPPQTKYPILYPAVLAVLWRLAPTLEARLMAMQVATLVAAAAAIATAYLYVVRFGYVTRAAAFAAGLLCASAPNVLYYASSVLSEMPFALVLVAALWIIETFVRAPATPRRALFAGVVAGLPFLVRSAGVIVPLAALVVAAHAKRPARWMLVGTALVTLPWILWMTRGIGNLAAQPIVGYQQDYIGHWSSGYFGYASGSRLALAAGVFATNVVKACVAVGEIGYEGLARVAYARSEHARTALMLIGAAAWMAIAFRARRLELLPVTLVAYGLLVCSWPWPPDRFLVPVLFFLVATLFTLVLRVGRRQSARAAAAGLASALALGAVPNVLTLAEYASVNARSHYPYFMLPEAPVAWNSYRDAFAWLRGHTANDDVLAAGFDSMTALYTAHATIRPFVPRPSSLYYGGTAPALGTPDDLTQALAAYRARYLFVSPLPAFPEEDAVYELVATLRRERPDELRLVYQGTDPRFAIFELHSTPDSVETQR